MHDPRYHPRGGHSVEPILREKALYRRLSEDDRRRLSDVSLVRSYPKGETILSEGDISNFLYTIAKGRVKVVKMLPAGKEESCPSFVRGLLVGRVVNSWPTEGRRFVVRVVPSCVGREFRNCVQTQLRIRLWSHPPFRSAPPAAASA